MAAIAMVWVLGLYRPNDGNLEAAVFLEGYG